MDNIPIVYCLHFSPSRKYTESVYGLCSPGSIQHSDVTDEKNIEACYGPSLDHVKSTQHVQAAVLY